MKSKALSYTVQALGYIFQYALPLLFFAITVPLTKGGGLSVAGYIVLIVALCIFAWHLYSRINKWEKSIKKVLILSIPPVLIWLVAGIGLTNLMIFIQGLVKYWWTAFIFILIGRMFFAIDGYLAQIKEKDNE